VGRRTEVAKWKLRAREKAEFIAKELLLWQRKIEDGVGRTELSEWWIFLGGGPLCRKGPLMGKKKKYTNIVWDLE